MLSRSKVGWSVIARDYGRTCAPGEAVSLDERLPGGGTLADLVRPEWFEAEATPVFLPLEAADVAASAPLPFVRGRGGRSSNKPVPATPAAKE